jgi:hypothetical protein
MLMQGQEVQILPGQNDEVHAMIHISKLGELNEQIIAGAEQAPPENQEEAMSYGLAQITPQMQAVADHLQEHLMRCNQSSPAVKQMEGILQRMRGVIENGQKQILRLQQASAREMEHNGMVAGQGEGGNGQEDPKLAQAQMKLEYDQRMLELKAHGTALVNNAKAAKELQNFRHATRMQEIAERKAQQALQIADLKAARDIRNQK